MKSRMRFVGAGAVLIASLFAPTVASAVDSYHQAKLKFVYPQGGGGFVIGFVTGTSACSSASNPQYFYVRAGVYGVTAEGIKGLLATALTAFAMDKSVAIAFDGTSQYCDVNRLSVEN